MLSATAHILAQVAAKKNPSPSATPTDAATSTSTAGGPIMGAFDWVISNPIPVLAIAAIIGIAYGWKQLRMYNAQRGKALPPLGFIIRRALKFAFKEDVQPVSKRISALHWLKWRYMYILIVVAAVALHLAGRHDLLTLVVIFAFILWYRARKVFAIRHSRLMQMFNVAAAEFRYPKGSELNPWGYINVTEWLDMYRPGTTIVTYPAGFQSEDLNSREKFERNFSGSVSDENSFTYQWESAKNRVIASPTPYLPATARYPGKDDHPWDEFPLGITWGGEAAVWPVGVTPHILIAGPTGSGKLLECSTKIPTPSGWTTMGELKPGMRVLDEKGQPTTVTWVSDINEKPDLYEVVFSDGSSVFADADHLWWTETRSARQSRWDETRSGAERRCLLSDTGLAAVRLLAETSSDAAETTLADFARVAGIQETAGWFREVADEIGHVSEIQVVSEFRYAEQTVTQCQKAEVFDAREAWLALAAFQPKTSRWFSSRDVIVEHLAAAGSSDEVSSAAIADALGVTKKDIGNVLLANGVAALRREGAGKTGTSYYPAEAAWRAFLSAADRGIPRWIGLQPEFSLLADAAKDGDVVLGRDVSGRIGFKSNAEGVTLLRKLGVRSEKRAIEVELAVPEKMVVRGGNIARAYLTRLLAEKVLERIERPAHDQRHKMVLGSVKTTREILGSLFDKHGYANHSIPLTGALQLPEVALPIPPYALGVWLGDGSSRGGEFVGIDHEIAEFLRSDGFTLNERLPSAAEMRHVDYRIWTVRGLRSALREQGLIQRNTPEGSQKRIPDAYLRASIAQRRALLAGLLDTDGTVAPQGTVQFTNTNETLAIQVLELARSLGYRATLTSAIKRAQTGTEALAFTVSWTCAESPFRLTRKTQAHAERNANFSEERNGSRFIVEVRPVDSRPGRCIAVDAPSRLFLCGEAMIPTHNSVVQRTILLHALQSPDWRVVGIDPKMVELGPYKHHNNVLKIATQLEDAAQLLESSESEMKRRYEEMTQYGVNHFKDLPPDPETGQRLPALLIMVDETYALLAPEGIKSDDGKERDALHARCTVLIGSIARLGRAAGVHLVLATQRPDAKVLPGETRNNLDARIACGRMDTTPSLMVLDSDHATRLPLIKGRSVLRLGGEVKEYQGYFVPIDEVDPIVQKGLARSLAKRQGVHVEDEPEHDEAGRTAGGAGSANARSGDMPGGGGLKGWWDRKKAEAAESDTSLAVTQGIPLQSQSPAGPVGGSLSEDEPEQYWGAVDPEPVYEPEPPRTTESGYPLEEPVEPERTKPVNRNMFGSRIPDPVPMGQPMPASEHAGPRGASSAPSVSSTTNGWLAQMREQEALDAQTAAVADAEVLDYGFDDEESFADPYPVYEAPVDTDPYPIAIQNEAPAPLGMSNEAWSGEGNGWNSDETPLAGLFGGPVDVPPEPVVIAPPAETVPAVAPVQAPDRPAGLLPTSRPTGLPTRPPVGPAPSLPAPPPPSAPARGDRKQFPPTPPQGDDQPKKQFPPRRPS